jgi:phosphatidylglycerophosphate synthase
MFDRLGFASSRSSLSRALERMGPTLQLTLLLLFGSVLSQAVALLLVGFDPAALGLSLLGYLVAAALAINSIRKGFPHALLGFGNLVTIARMAMVFALLAPLLAGVLPWALVAVAITALVLDGFDGFIARREGRVSSFGARLDMEVDSVLGLILAINVVVSGSLGAWVLLLGLPRYLFIVAAKLWPWINQPLPDKLSRKVVAVVQISTLIGLNSPLFPNWFEIMAALVVAAAMVWSFGRDIIWAWRARS